MKQELQAAVQRIRDLALEKNAEGVVALDLVGLCSYADALVVCQGRSTRQAQAIATHISQTMKEEGILSIGVEGFAQGNWILVDFADIVVHVFYEPVRVYYQIEGIWPDAKNVSFEDDPAQEVSD